MKEESLGKLNKDFDSSLEDIGLNLQKITKFLFPSETFSLLLPVKINYDSLSIFSNRLVGALWEPFDFEITLEDYQNFKAR